MSLATALPSVRPAAARAHHATPARRPAPVAGSARHVIHAGNGALWGTVTSMAAATACALLALQDLRWLALTFAFLVLAVLAVWRWVASGIVLDGRGIVVGRMFGLDTVLAYADMARVRFIRVETGDATRDWRVQERIAGLQVPFESTHPQGRAHGPLLELRIVPRAAAARRELRLDLTTFARPADIQVLHDQLARGVPGSPRTAAGA